MVSDLVGAGFELRLAVSIRFEVRGGFRLQLLCATRCGALVSIRFEVRGGFRRCLLTYFGLFTPGFNPL